MDELEQLTALLHDANTGRSQYGMSEADVDAEIARISNGKYKTRTDLSAAVRHLTTNPTAIAERRQAQMASDIAGDVNNPAPAVVGVPGVTPIVTVPGSVMNLPEAFGHGALPLTEELGGLVDAATGGSYRQGREHAMARNEAFRQAHPAASMATNVAGGLASAPTMLKAFGPATTALEKLFGVTQTARGASPVLWNLAKQGAAAGIPVGAFYGASDAPTLGSVPGEAAKGAAFAAATGAPLAAALPAAASLLLGGRRGLQSFFNPQQQALEQVYQRLGRVIDPRQASAQLAEAERAVPGQAMLGDVHPTAFGVGMRGAPEGEAVRQQLQSRAAAGAERLAQRAEGAAGVPMVNGQPRAVSAIAASEAADPAFTRYSQSVYQPIEEANKTVDVSIRPKIAEVLQDEAVRPVLRRVLGREFEVDPTVLGKRWSQYPPEQQANFRARGIGPAEPRIPFKALQEVESELGRMADRAPVGSNYTVERYRTLQRSLRDATREEVGAVTSEGATRTIGDADAGWRAATEIFGPRESARGEGLLGQFAEGANALSLPVEQVQQHLRRLSTQKLPNGLPNEEAASAYKIGLLDAVTRHLRSLREGVDPIRVATSQGDRSIEGHLREVFGSEREVEKFLRRADVERFFRRSAQQFGEGSATEPRAQLRQILFPNEGEKRGLTRRVWDQFQRDAVTVPPQMLQDAYAQVLPSRGAEAVRHLTGIARSQAEQANYGPLMQRAARAAGVVAGGPAGTPIGYTELLAGLAALQGARRAKNFVTGGGSRVGGQ